MPNHPYAKLLIGAAFSLDRDTIVVAKGRVPGAGGKLFIERSADKPLPPPFDLRCEPGNPGSVPDFPPHTDATAFLQVDGGLGGTIQLRHADHGKADIAIQPLTDDLTMSSGWAAGRNTAPETKVSVLGLMIAPTAGYRFRLEKASPQGINPQILLLKLSIDSPTGGVPQVITPVVVSFEECDTDKFTDVEIMAGGSHCTFPIGNPQ